MTVRRTFERADPVSPGPPHQEWEVQARRAAVHRRDPSGAGAPPGVVVYDFDNVVGVLRDDAAFSSRIVSDAMAPGMGDQTLLGIDGVEHDRCRALVSSAFRPRTLERWRETLVVPIVHDLVDAFVERGRCDLVPALTDVFPVKIIAALLGLPGEDFVKLGGWARRIVASYEDPDAGQRASAELREYVRDLVDHERAAQSTTLIGSLMAAEVDGRRLTDQEVFSFIVLLLPAGVETTSRFAGNLLYALLTHPDQLSAVRERRELVGQAVEEGLRWEPPFSMTARVARRAAVVGDQAVPAGSSVLLMLGAANRDERRYVDPHRFDISRPPKPHVGFGGGLHACLGMHLARLETVAALEAVLDRLPEVAIDPAADAVRIEGYELRSPPSLPVVFEPREVRRLGGNASAPMPSDLR